MNHCVLEVEVTEPPKLRYTQDNKTPITEVEAKFDGLRPDDPDGKIRVIGWGNLAQELEKGVIVGQKLIVEGRLRMNTIPRQDGTKEKRAEFTLAKMHPVSESTRQRDKPLSTNNPKANENKGTPKEEKNSLNDMGANSELTNWNSSPLVPETDDIPF